MSTYTVITRTSGGSGYPEPSTTTSELGTFTTKERAIEEADKAPPGIHVEVIGPGDEKIYTRGEKA